VPQGASAPFQRINVDFHGPLPESEEGFNYIFSVYDQFSKYVIFVPTKDATALTAARALVDHVFSIYGWVEQIHSDNGPAFIAQLLENVLALLKVKHTFSLPYRPTTNGGVERAHRTLDELLATIVDKRTDWPKWTALVAYQMNTAKSATTGVTPYEVVFGKEPTGSLDAALNPSDKLSAADTTSYTHLLAERLKHIHQVVEDNTKVAQMKQKEHFDKKKSNVEFALGQKVYLDKRVSGKKVPKLMKKFMGPYTVMEKINNVNYIVAGRGKRLRVHASVMKDYDVVGPNELLYVDMTNG
jgi:hypothetical protein